MLYLLYPFSKCETMNVLCLLPFLLLMSSVNCSLTVEYYEKLINKITSEAQKYELPQINEQFQEGFESAKIEEFESFDFIIVGAGSAGSVLATRLSEISSWNILLVEAGGEENDFSNIPDMFMFLQFTEMNWGYRSTPQKHACLGMREKRCMVPRGKAIGGSSAINAVMYTRGNPGDFDKWAELGNPGWSYKDVLPHFIKSENLQFDGDEDYHGTGGLLNVEIPTPNLEIFEHFEDALHELNITLLDMNGKEQIGFSKNQLNIKHGRRQSTGTAFLDNARKRQNLRVVTKALVTKIEIDEQNKVAQGIQFVTNGKKFRATANKEVILSGGSINSPQLLILSGIGPKNHLNELEIKVLADLPVGENLQDHVRFPGLVFHTNYTLPNIDMKTLIQEYLDGDGLLTNPGIIDGLGFIKTKQDPDVPTVEYILFTPGSSLTPIIPRVVNYDEKLVENYLQKLDPNSDIQLHLILLHPKSKGRIRLQSKSPIDFPDIDLNLFSEQQDIETLIEGIEFILKLANTEAFKRMNAELVDIPICENYEKFSKPFWECIIRHIAVTIFHPTGTTAMGPDPKTSVVDHNLKVHGIGQLRVVDAGVFPSTLSGHPNAAVIMAAEKISDVIKKKYSANYHFGSHNQCENYCSTV